MSLDLAAELVAALRSEDGRAAVREAVGQVIAHELRAALAAQAADRLVPIGGLAELLGCPSPAAAKMRVQRDPELANIALRMGARRLWRVSEVLRLLEERRGAR